MPRSTSSEALRHLDGMTERERFATRGFYYRMTGDYQQCVKEYGELIARYRGRCRRAQQPRALCLSKLRNMREAVDEMRQAVQILPNRVLFRGNLALYADYAGDFADGGSKRSERYKTGCPGDSRLALSLNSGQGRLAEATDNLQKLANDQCARRLVGRVRPRRLGPYEGRFRTPCGFSSRARPRIWRPRTPTERAQAHVARLRATLARRRRPPRAAAEKALRHSKAVPIRFLAARIFVETGALAKARPLARLASELAAEPQAYGKIVEGEIALKSGDARQAIKILTEANGVLDTWLGHFDLGRAYLAADAFPQADSEFDRCIKRRGEALSLFLDEEPTYGYFPPSTTIRASCARR